MSRFMGLGFRLVSSKVMPRRLGRAGRFVRTGLATGAILAGAVGLTSTVAQAATTDVVLLATNSSLALDVSGASTAAGGPVIQWYSNGGQNQQWTIPGVGYAGPIINDNSNMCLTTDGVAGDQLTQQPCGLYNPNQRWNQYEWDNGWARHEWFQNPASGLVVDVYGSSQWAGAPIDAWYPNGGDNQSFVPFGG